MTRWIKRMGSAVALLALSWSTQAELTIQVTKAAPNSMPIAIVPFADQAGAGDLSDIVRANLERSGKFKPLSAGSLPSQPTMDQTLNPAQWEASGVRFVVRGQTAPTGRGTELKVSIYDVRRQSDLGNWRFEGGANTQRRLAHRASDAIYEALLGEPGAFDTRLVYVSTQRDGQGLIYQLNVADSDGRNPFAILQHRRPIISPAWSPDAERLAYVTYENNNRMAIYVQELRTGQRSRLAAYSGINGTPAWSPDGSNLAVTLSKDGNPEIYLLNAGGGGERRLTNDSSIDTEPTFSPDGRWIYFTSDRSGQPQIYRMSASGGGAERITRSGSYSADPSISPNGKVLGYVTQSGGSYRVAAMDIGSGRSRVLSPGPLDESPSFAPNGSMIIYASESYGSGELGAVSLDGQVNQRITLPSEGVREPAWSPKRR